METFTTIKEYPQYAISKTGKVMKLSNHKILKPSKKKNGYLQINLFTNDRRRKKEYIHRLVAITYIPNPNKFPEVNHIDRVRSNNKVENLEWVTRTENIEKSSIKKKIKVFKNGKFLKEYDSIQDACKELNLTDSNVSACLHSGNQHTHKGYYFNFA